MDRRHRDVLIACAIIATCAPSRAYAESPPSSGSESKASDKPARTSAVIAPVTTPIEPTAKDPLRRVGSSDTLATRAREVEGAVKDAAQDLGLELDLTGQVAGDGGKEQAMIARAATGAWVIAIRIEAAGSDQIQLRITAVAPKSSTLHVHLEKVDAAHAAPRAAAITRDLVTAKNAASTASAETEPKPGKPVEELTRSRGRPILAASSALFGLYGAYSIYKSAGSDDARVLYPLLALGAGAGLGVALLASDEWDVTPGVAWTLAAGGWWGVVAGLNLADSQNVQPSDDRLAWGLGAGLVGTAALVTTVSLKRFDEGDAAMTHSGAAFGTLGGALVDMLGRGTLKQTPSLGLGLGAGIGLLGGATLAVLADASPGRVMLVDLGAGLGALAGAACGSPLIFKDETDVKARVFVSAVLGGTIGGAAIAYFATRGGDAKPSAPAKPKASFTRVLPYAGIVGASTIGNESKPAFGAGLAGMF